MSQYLRAGQDPASWVTEAYPPALLRVLDENQGLPYRVRQSIEYQLRPGTPYFRTPVQLRNRIERRWFRLYAHRTRAELKADADQIAIKLVEPSDCPAGCEDGWNDDSTSCLYCGTARPPLEIRVPGTVEEQVKASPERAAQMAAAIRAQIRRDHGLPRGQRSRHQLRGDLESYVPKPHMREPEQVVEDEDVQPATPRWRLREPEDIVWDAPRNDSTQASR